MNTKIKIGGTHCSKCKERLENLISRFDEVESVNFILADEIADINSSKALNLDFLKEEIEDMGFEYLGIIKN